MQALLIATTTVALAEIGDKTQLLALMMAARYRKPGPIIAGIFVATLANHAASAWVGAWLAGFFSAQALRAMVIVSFLAVAAWSLVPDKLDEDARPARFGPFLATLVAFFLVEIGDKTQVATIVLAANYSPLWQVIVGTTAGMLLANVPVVVLGARFSQRLPLRAARITAALLFAGLACWVAWQGWGQ